MRQLKIQTSITNRDTVSLEKYLAEIGRIEMITPEQEVELARQIREGGPKAQEARDKLVCANLRFVVSVAKQYQNGSVGLADLINEGNIGLITAAQRFDDTRGFKFISYAVWWVRQAIMLALGEQSRIVRIPQNQENVLAKVAKFTNKFEQENQRRPSLMEIADQLDLEIEKIGQTMGASGKHVSVDAPLIDGEEHSLLDVLTNSESAMADEALNQEALSQEMKRVLGQLSQRESDIVRMSFGIGCDEMSLDEIGLRFNLTRERVRQIKDKAIRRLRGDRSATLRAFLG